MKDNSKNREKGNTLSLIVTCALFIVVIGLGVDFMLMIFKGHRRLTNTSDSIALELVKNIIRTPKVKLTPGYEMDNWGPLSDNGWIDLYRFNKIVAQTILSAANAAADGSSDALDAANDMIDHLQGTMGGGGDPGRPPATASLGARLKAELEKAAHDFSNGGDINGVVSDLPVSLHPAAMADPGSGYCGYVGAPGRCGSKGSKSGQPSVRQQDEEGSGGRAGSNGGWCRGGSWDTVFPTPPAPATTVYQAYSDGNPSSEKAAFIASQKFGSYVDRDGASNVSLNPLALPIIVSGSVVDPANRIQIGALIDKGGKKYLPGYKEIKFLNGNANTLKSVAAVPMEAGSQPHLVSTKIFEESVQNNFLTSCVLPPNAYKFIASSVDSHGQNNMVVSVAEVSSGPQTFPTQYERAYIEFINIGDRASYDYNGDATTTTNVYAKELMSGIYLSDNGAFSTDPAAIKEWAAYNDGTSSTKPALTDSNGNVRVFGKTDTIHGFKPKSSGSRGDQPCIWMNVTHGSPDYYDSQCGDRLKDFEAAYPPGEAQNGDPTSYMAVEQFKQTIRSVFNACGSYGCPKDSTGLRVYTDGWPNHGTDVNGGDPATNTGRYWRDQINPVPSGANSKVSRAGTVLELLQQIDPEKTASTLELVKNKIFQIKNDTTEAQIMQMLTKQTLELGQCAYIYKDLKGDLQFTTTKPPSMVGDISNVNDPKRKPVGRTRTISSEDYATVGTLVNPPKEGDIHLQLYTSYPDPKTVGTARDMVEETVGIGTNNNLLRLRFINKCGGAGGGGGAVLSSSGDFCQPD